MNRHRPKALVLALQCSSRRARHSACDLELLLFKLRLVEHASERRRKLSKLSLAAAAAAASMLSTECGELGLAEKLRHSFFLLEYGVLPSYSAQ